jgi:hypothetical protein
VGEIEVTGADLEKIDSDKLSNEATFRMAFGKFSGELIWILKAREGKLKSQEWCGVGGVKNRKRVRTGKRGRERGMG